MRAASMSAVSRQAPGGAAAAFGLPTPQQQRDALLGPHHRASARRPSLPPLPPRHVRRSSCSATAPLRTHSGPVFGRPGHADIAFASPYDRQVGSSICRHFTSRTLDAICSITVVPVHTASRLIAQCRAAS